MNSAIRIEGVTKRFDGVQALAGIDLEILQGEFFGLLGPNGAGKTTLISALAGLVRPDAGRLAVMGHDVVSAYRAARRTDEARKGPAGRKGRRHPPRPLPAISL